MKYRNNVKILMPVVYPVGGIRSYIRYTFPHFVNSGFEITLISHERKWLDWIKEDMRGCNIETIVVTGKSSEIRFAATIFKTLRNDKYDIIHSQGYTAGIIASIINMFFGIPHIITLHRVFKADQFADKTWNQYGSFKRKILGYILSTADYVQAVSNDAMNNVKDNFPIFRRSDKKLIVIRNGIEVEAFLNNRSSNTIDIKEAGKVTIGFLGRYMPEKGFEYVIDAVEMLVHEQNMTNFKVVTTGGLAGFVREYKKKIIRKHLTDYFQFLDFTANVSGLLKQFDVLLVPSLGEAGPLLPMEALICGTPVIAFSSIGLRETLADTPAIMVEAKDVSQLTKAIVDLIANEEHYKKTFADFAPIAAQKYNVQETAEKLRSVYDTMLEKRMKRKL